MHNFQNVLDNFKEKYQQEYGIAVFDIDFKEIKKGIEIKGEVLTESQRDDIVNILKKNKKNIIKENIKVLTDTSKRNEISWAVVRSDILDLKLRYVSNKILNEKILKRIRCSQAFRGEILRVLYKNEDQLLVQQNDLTLGWIDRKNIVFKKKSLYKEWKQGNYAIKDKAISLGSCHFELVSEPIIAFKKNNKIKNKQQISKQSILEIIEEAEKYLDARYIIGGKSKKGIDCSGLTQVAYKNSLGIILPKHSWDQKEMGGKVKLKDVKTGDLIFLIKKKNDHKHVGIVEVSKDKINLIHASLDKRKVVKQNLKEVFEKYDFVEAKRILMSS